MAKQKSQQPAAPQESTEEVQATVQNQEPVVENTESQTAQQPAAPLSVGSVKATASFLTKESAPVDLHPGLPRIKIKYPEDYKRTRHYKDGDIVPVSREIADILVKDGIATVVNG